MADLSVPKVRSFVLNNSPSGKTIFWNPNLKSRSASIHWLAKLSILLTTYSICAWCNDCLSSNSIRSPFRLILSASYFVTSSVSSDLTLMSLASVLSSIALSRLLSIFVSSSRNFLIFELKRPLIRIDCRIRITL